MCSLRISNCQAFSRAKTKKEIEKREEFLRNNPNFQPKAYKVFNIIQMVSIIILVVCTLLFFIILAFSNGNAFKDDFVFFSVFLIIEIVGLIIDIIICGILKSCFKRR